MAKPKPSQHHTMPGASPGSAQHLASKIAKARDRKQVKSIYSKALK